MAEFTFTEAEFFRGCAEISKRYLLIRLVLILLISVFVGNVIAAELGELWLGVVVASLFCGSMVALHLWVRNRRWKSVFHKQEAGSLTTVLEVSPEEVIIEHQRGRGVFRPQNLFEVKETKEFFLLFSQKHLAHIVPKRALSGDEMEDLRSFAQAVK